jgi:methylated-DNA-[protein]-cysteine S-methyltransferase
MAYYGLTDTAFGSMLIAVDGERMIALKFGVDEKRMASAVEDLHRGLRGAFPLERNEAKIKPVATRVRDYLAGKRSTLDIEFDVSWIDGFRREVLLECARIPRGQVATYAELARRVGRPNAYRAVGNTMRTNPIPILIPCHRVVGSNGSLTGFGGGLDMKQKLLQLEGAR